MKINDCIIRRVVQIEVQEYSCVSHIVSFLCGVSKEDPPGHHGREGFVRLRDYPSISIFSPDLSSTVKWSSQTMIRSSQRFTRASSKAFSCAGCCLMKSCSSLMRAICASLAAVSTVHFSRCSRSLKISSAISSYPKIKEYVKDKYGVNVHTSYIAQVKRMCGLDMVENYNKSKKENPEVKQCPQEKVEHIKECVEAFQIDLVN